MALDTPFSASAAGSAFYLAGGYKYAMAGEGMGLMHCPPGYGERPPLTGWYAEFDDLSLPPGWLAIPATPCGLWARPSIRLRCTASIRFAECSIAKG